MAHILYKPHVVGPEGHITTPDIVIDRVALQTGAERHLLPVHRIWPAVELQVIEGEFELAPAYAAVGCGGGALLGVAAILRARGQAIATADVLLARAAWRLRNIIDHFGKLQLRLGVGGETGAAAASPSAPCCPSARRLGAGGETGAAALSELPQPAQFMRATENGEPGVLRGVVELCAAAPTKLSTSARVRVSLQLADLVRNRCLAHTVELVPVSAQRWGEWPLPRYAVGPVAEVEHYI